MSPRKLSVAAAFVLTSTGLVARAPLIERTVAISVADEAGRPVTDVAADDLTVLENDVPREVLHVVSSSASSPAHVASQVPVDTPFHA